MRNTFKLFGIAAIAAAAGLALAGCGTAPSAEPSAQLDPALEIRVESERVGWSAHPPVHASRYEVVGAIVIRNVNRSTLVADLMTQAIAMGGHDIINVRVDTVTEGSGRRRAVRVTSASAVAIRYVGPLHSAESE